VGPETSFPYDSHAMVTLKRLVIHQGCRPAEADDIVQETLCRALEQASKGESTPSDGWLRVVASRLIIDRYRRSSRDAQLCARLGVELVPDHSVEVVEKLLAIFADSVLAALPLMQRDVLNDISRGLTVADIASQRQLTVRSVEGHLRRARAEARRLLE